MKIVTKSHRIRFEMIKKMEDYVYTHSEHIGVMWWDNEIHKLSTRTKPDEIIEDISQNDEKCIDALYIFYVAVITDTSWLDVVVDAYRETTK